MRGGESGKKYGGQNEKSFDSRMLTVKPNPLDSQQWLWPDGVGRHHCVSVFVSVWLHYTSLCMQIQKER